MRANVDILEKYIENLVIKKNLLQSSVEAYKLDINEYLSFLENKEKDMLVGDIDGIMVAVALMPAPIPNNEAVDNAKTNYRNRR